MLLLAYSIAFAQSGCVPATSLTQLDVNNVKAKLRHCGSLWWDGEDAGYEVPKGGGVHTMFAGGLWIGGFDPEGELRLAAQRYGIGDNVDFYPGPLDDNGEITPDQCTNYDRFWETSSTDINAFLADWSDGNLDDSPPPSITSWPATGNPFFEIIFGFDLPPAGHDMAPFIDTNNDGLYNPLDGDYPDIYQADQAIWWVFNDAGSVHAQSAGMPLHVEVQMMAYAYETADELNDATFYNITFINQSSEMLDSVYMGLWFDPSLGCYLDDYIGCHPDENLVYTYNADTLDGILECECTNGVTTYCEQVPMSAIKILEGAKGQRVFDVTGELKLPPPGVEPDTLIDCGLSSLIYYFEDLCYDGIYGVHSPFLDQEHYNYLNGIWASGVPLTAEEDGYNPNGGIITKFAFPDSPDDPNGWSMCSENMPGECVYYPILSSGPFQLQPGATNGMSFAVLFVPDVPYPCPSVTHLQEACQAAENVYDQMVPTKEIHSPHLTVNAIPNPFTDQAQLFFPDLRDQVDQVQLFSVDGRLVRQYLSVPGNSLTIDRGGLCDGMYFYKVITRGQRFVSGKLVLK